MYRASTKAERVPRSISSESYRSILNCEMKGICNIRRAFFARCGARAQRASRFSFFNGELNVKRHKRPTIQRAMKTPVNVYYKYTRIGRIANSLPFDSLPAESLHRTRNRARARGCSPLPHTFAEIPKL